MLQDMLPRYKINTITDTTFHYLQIASFIREMVTTVSAVVALYPNDNLVTFKRMVIRFSTSSSSILSGVVSKRRRAFERATRSHAAGEFEARKLYLVTRQSLTKGGTIRGLIIIK